MPALRDGGRLVKYRDGRNLGNHGLASLTLRVASAQHWYYRFELKLKCPCFVCETVRCAVGAPVALA